MIDRVAEESTGKDWDKATDKPIYEFLTIYNYSIVKQQLQEKNMKARYGAMIANV